MFLTMLPQSAESPLLFPDHLLCLAIQLESEIIVPVRECVRRRTAQLSDLAKVLLNDLYQSL